MASPSSVEFYLHAHADRKSATEALRSFVEHVGGMK
jgi:hypothetical protein